MTPITPKNLIKHELIGLDVTLIKSKCKSYVGFSGKVVDESRNMLIIDDGKRRRSFPKEVSHFLFKLPSGQLTLVDGRVLVGRPEDRLKKRLIRW